MLNLVNATTNQTFLVPQTILEVGFDYVSKAVESVNVCKHRGIIAIITTGKLKELLNPQLKGVGSTRCILVKSNYPTNTPEEDRVPINKFLYAAPSDFFNGIDCNTSFNELSVYNLVNFVQSDRELRMSLANGDIYSKVSTGSVHSMLANENSSAKFNGKLIKSVAETAVVIGFKIIALSDLQGWNDKGLQNYSPVKGLRYFTPTLSLNM